MYMISGLTSCHGCLNKTWRRRTSIDMLTWKKSHGDPQPYPRQRTIGNKEILRAGKLGTSPQRGCPIAGPLLKTLQWASEKNLNDKDWGWGTAHLHWKICPNSRVLPFQTMEEKVKDRLSSLGEGALNTVSTDMCIIVILIYLTSIIKGGDCSLFKCNITCQLANHMFSLSMNNSHSQKYLSGIYF